MQKWEYKVITAGYSYKPEFEFNANGKEGWELVSVAILHDHMNNKVYEAWFKRPINNG